jgi:hypothetical protein
MKVQEAIQQQLAMWHGVLQSIVGECAPDVLNKRVADNATITSIAPIYAHVAFGEDTLTNVILRGKTPLYKEQGWEAKTGLPMPETPALTQEWASKLALDLPTFQEYAGAVFSATEAYIADMPDDELDRTIQTQNFGEKTVGWMLSTIVATHVPQHTGEIAALKGVQGLKGLPF